MTNIRNALMQAAGSASGDKVYVEDVFNTTLFIGNSADNRDFVTGLDMSGEGGMCWFKCRGTTDGHEIYDTVRGVNKVLFAEGTNAETTQTSSLTAFNNDGFELSSNISVNVNTRESVGWSFRKKEGFFDVVTYTGTGSSKTVSHNLGCVPGMIIVKMITTAGYKWRVWHKSLGNNMALCLNDDSAESDDGGGGGGWWNNTAPTSSVFSVGTYGQTNNNGDTFVAYLFADGDNSAAQIFGDDGDEAIIKCGTVSTNSSGVIATDANLGFEPQWLLIKSTGSGSWNLFDTMRGLHGEKIGNNKYLRPNNSNAEANASSVDGEFITATGFGANGGGVTGSANATFIYVAIRRGPMKVPDAGTDVYIQDLSSSTTYESPFFQSPWPVDLGIYRKRTSTEGNYASARITDTNYLITQLTSLASPDNANVWDFMNGYYDLGSGYYADYASIMFRRYPKVFDIVVGISDASGNVWNGSHNLNANIEFAIVKNTQRASTQWWTAHLALGKGYKLNQDAASNDLGTDFTTTTTTFKAFSGYLENSESFVMYAFASLSGISKVGSYSGTGSDVNVDCGFSGGARFVLVKRSDSTGDWYVFDTTVQGIIAGDDPYWLLNSNAADVTNTDYVDPHSSGFTVTSSAPAGLNASGGTYIFLAFA